MKNIVESILMGYCLIIATLYLVSMGTFVWYLIKTLKTLSPKPKPEELTPSQLKTKAYQEIGEVMDADELFMLSESSLSSSLVSPAIPHYNNFKINT